MNEMIKHANEFASEVSLGGDNNNFDFDDEFDDEFDDMSDTEPPFDKATRDRYVNGEEMTGDDLAKLYSYEIDSAGLIAYESDYQLVMKMMSIKDERYLEGAEAGRRRYEDYQKMAGALGVTVGALVEANVLQRIDTYGLVSFKQHMANELGCDDGKGEYEHDDRTKSAEWEQLPHSESWNNFIDDPTVPLGAKMLFLHPASLLGNKQCFEQMHGCEISYDDIAKATDYEGGDWYSRQILEDLEWIHEHNLSFGLGDLSKVIGKPIAELLRDSESVRNVFGNGEIVDGEFSSGLLAIR